MKKEVISILIALPLSLLVMFMLTSDNLQSVYAQGPDVEIMGAADTTIFMSPPIVPVPVDGTGTSIVTLINGPLAGNLTEARVEVLFPSQYVHVVSDADIQPTIAGGLLTVLERNNTLGRLTFEILFTVPIPPGGTLNPPPTAIATITWTGIAFSDGPQPVIFDDVEVTDNVAGALPLAPSEKFGNAVDVIRPPITVFIDRNIVNPPPCRIDAGQTLVTQVIADDIVHVDRVGFELDFDARFVQVNEVRPGSFFEPAPIKHLNEIDNNNGRIDFDYERSTPRNAGQAVIAEIEWEGLRAGTSYQQFIGDVRMFANGIQVLDPPTPITEIDGCDITVDPQQITIYLDPSQIVVDENGEPVRQDVKLRGVRNVEEVAFKLKYDQNLVQIVNPRLSLIHI